jgi:hypothetical protein
LRTASSIPHQEATSSLVKQMEKLIAPLKEEIRKLKEQGNTHALDATGPARVEERSGVNPRFNGAIKARSASGATQNTSSYDCRPATRAKKRSRGAGQVSPEAQQALTCGTKRGSGRPSKRARRRKAQEAKAQAQGQRPGGVISGDDTLSRRASKRRRLESTRPMYLSQADLLEMDRDQLVGKILMRMTPWQFETRCTRNVVHFVLSEQQRSNALWSNPAVHTLLGKGPRFIPKARSLSTTEVQTACARLGYRLVRAFERYVDGGYHEMRMQAMKEEGIRSWTPRQRQLSASFCRSYVSSFFKCQRVDGGAWRSSQFFSPS